MTKSNALSQLAGAAMALARGAAKAAGAATKPTGGEALMLGLVSIGICVLVVWTIRRAARPAKLRLADTPGRSNTINPAHVLVLLLAWQGAGELAAWLLAPRLGRASGELDILVAMIRQTVWLVLSGAVAAVTFRNGLARGMGLSLRHWMFDTGRAVLAYLAVLPVCFGLFLASKALYVWAAHQAPPEHAMLVVIRQASLPWAAMGLVSAVILAPLSEEVFCRGLVQSMLRRHTASPWAAILLASAIFALLHWDSLAPGAAAAGWIQLPALFALAVALGYNYERSGRLFSPILMHVLFNGVSIAAFLAS